MVASGVAIRLLDRRVATLEPNTVRIDTCAYGVSGALLFPAMSGEAQLMLMIAGVHLLGLACVAVLMIPALRDPPDSPPRPSDGGSDDGWGNYPRRPPSPSDVPGGGLPLPDAEPARVRLRDHRRLADGISPRERRPAREPERVPVLEPPRAVGVAVDPRAELE
jgi:hypothetical protein